MPSRAEANSRNVKTFYVSYDGVLEPLGESQVVSYLERLSPTYEITLLSFEKAGDAQDAERVSRMRARLAAVGIRWVSLRYHKRPLVLSTAFDVLRAMWFAFLWFLRGRARLVHARGYVPSLIAVFLKSMFGTKFLFDMRGFWADEKVDGGHWSRQSVIYKITKRCEKLFFESADAIVSLTYEGVRAFPELGYRVRSGIPVEVIATCTDLERFAPGPKDPTLVSRLGLDGHLVIGCTGSMSAWYLRQQMLEYLAYLAQNLDRARIVIVTQEDHENLWTDALSAGIPKEQTAIVRASFAEMPEYVRLMDLGIFFLKVCFSKKGSCATKLGEFLATGIPVVINAGVGDSGRIVQEHKVGVVLSQVGIEEFADSLSKVEQLFDDPLIKHKCRDVARRYFDLSEGIKKYAMLYRTLGGTASAPAGSVWKNSRL
ncbi:MAG: glycosyltransferase, partial [Dehalococcoidia bacterium]